MKKKLNARQHQKLFIKVMAETSYSDKPLDTASANIRKWRVELEKIWLPDEIRETLFYLMDSRQENIVILKDHYFKNDYPA